MRFTESEREVEEDLEPALRKLLQRPKDRAVLGAANALERGVAFSFLEKRSPPP